MNRAKDSYGAVEILDENAHLDELIEAGYKTIEAM